MKKPSRNSDDWFPFAFRAWLESLFIEELPGSAEGLYIRCLALQGLYGTIPADIPTLAKRLRRPLSYVRKEWPAIAEKFTADPEDATQLYNLELMAWRKTREAEKAGKVRGAEITNAKRRAERVAENPDSADAERALRASHSYSECKTSDSNSTTARTRAKDFPSPDSDKGGLGCPSFAKFYDLYPKKRGRNEAYKSWYKLRPDEALTETICAHVAAMRKTWDWSKDGGQYVPLPATYLNGSRWTDEIPEAPARNGNGRKPDSQAMQFAKGSTEETAPAETDEQFRQRMLQRRAEMRGCSVEELEAEDAEAESFL